MIRHQLVAFFMMLASVFILLATFVTRLYIPEWLTSLSYIAMFLIGCVITFQREEKQSALRFLKELKTLAHNFDEMTKDSTSSSLTSIARSISDLVGIEKVQEQVKPQGYDKEATAFANCIALCENSRRKQFFGNIIDYFMKRPKNLDSDILTKMVDEFVNMIVQHWNLAEHFVEVINRIGYVKKSMKDNFKRLEIEHNQLAADTKRLTQKLKEELLTEIRDYVPLIAKEFTAEAMDG